VVRWGDVWTPGANWATTLEVSGDVQLNGQTLARGKYSVWMIPRENESWTVFLNDNNRLFHTQKPKPESARLTLAVTPQTTPHAEVLTWSFPLVSSEGATLQMQWGTIAVPLDIRVTSNRVVAVPQFDAAPYLGSYHLKFEPQDPGAQAFELDVEIVSADGRLRARFSQPVPETDPYFDLLPAGAGTFKPQYLKGGKVFESDEETRIVFQLAGGRATGFEFVFNGEAYARATRK